VWSKTSQQVEMKVTTLVVIGTDFIGRYKHYYLRAQLQFIKKPNNNKKLEAQPTEPVSLT
jgi:hypothetical protein